MCNYVSPDICSLVSAEKPLRYNVIAGLTEFKPQLNYAVALLLTDKTIK